MKLCPFCQQEIPAEARVCKFCNASVVRKCPFCAEEIVAGARKCRFCQSDLTGAADAGKPKIEARAEVVSGPPGEERGIVLTLLLSFITCGVWGLVVQYQVGEELNRHGGKNRVNAGLDLLLSVLTCGLWTLYTMYWYPKVFQEITMEEGRAPVDVMVPCFLLAFFGLGVWSPFPIGLMIFQGELNKHWEEHRGVAPQS